MQPAAAAAPSALSSLATCIQMAAFSWQFTIAQQSCFQQHTMLCNRPTAVWVALPAEMHTSTTGSIGTTVSETARQLSHLTKLSQRCFYN
jgi:hypothetical protein